MWHAGARSKRINGEHIVEFRDLKKQYKYNEKKIKKAIEQVLIEGNFISGHQVDELEERLALYVGVKHCVSCANGTDALHLALLAWGVGEGDAVFVPDFTFFSTAEVVAAIGATPIFVDIDIDFNISITDLKLKIEWAKQRGLTLKVVIAVDLFGQPARFPQIREIVKSENMLLLEDGAQGFGGKIGEERACSFGDIATTSFFPAKPLGCYGDGGAIFTDNDEWAELLRSLHVHGKGKDKYDNIRIGMNSRLDTLQAAILIEKLKIFDEFELKAVNDVAERYNYLLEDINQVVTPFINENYYSSWAQYTILFPNVEKRNKAWKELREQGIPSMIYYHKPLHAQTVFNAMKSLYEDNTITYDYCNRVLSLPMHPYLGEEEQKKITNIIRKSVCDDKNGM